MFYSKMNTTNTPSDKSYLATGLLSILLGVLGAHRFYLGKIGSGLAQLFTFGGLGIWTFVDILIILFGTVKDSKGQIVTKDPKSSKILYGVFGAVVLVALVSPKNKTHSGSSDSSSSSSSSTEWTANKRNVVGLYYSDRGLAGFGGTCELLYGGGYFLKDQFLQNGQMIGEYSVSGNEITFYQDGSVVFKADVYKDRLDMGPGKATYNKK